jgi:hypothetical protein
VAVEVVVKTQVAVVVLVALELLLDLQSPQAHLILSL